jgi:hypothetical protein
MLLSILLENAPLFFGTMKAKFGHFTTFADIEVPE